MNIRSKTNISLLLILLGALIVRLWGINFGLPYIYFGDEGYLIYWAFYSGYHQLHQPYYLYAPLVPTILLGEFALYYIGGYLLGVFSTPSQFFVAFLSNPTMFFLIGRVTMAMVGVATVWLVYIIGKRFFNKRIGLLASFFLAFTLLHVKESHYIKQDVLMGFFVLASFYFALKILQNGKLRNYLLCGITFALAFGAKYQAILLLPIILLAHILKARKNGLKKLMALGGVSFITFCLIHPYFVIEPKVTLEKTLSTAAVSRVLYPQHLLGKPVWWSFFFDHIPQGIGYPLFILGILGLAICFWAVSRVKRGNSRVKRGARQKNYLFIPLLPILFFVTIDAFTKMHFARYAIIILPFLTLGAGVFFDFLGDFIKDEKMRNILLIVLAVVVISPSFLRSLKFDSLLTKPDSRTLAKQWFEKNIPASSKVFVESMIKPEHPANVNVSLNLDEHSIDQRINQAKQRGLDALYLKFLKIANKNKIGYNITAATQVDERRDLFTDVETPIQSVNYYEDRGIKYLILTSWTHDNLSTEFAKSFHDHYKLIKEFRATYDFKDDPHLVSLDYSTLDSVDMLGKNVIFGPVITIYKLKGR